MPDQYRPNLSEFCNILRDYSRHGLSYFDTQSADTRQKLRESISMRLEDNAKQIEYKLGAITKGRHERLGFLPMPRPGGHDFKASFFLPRIATRIDDPEWYDCSFVVVFWIERERGKTIAVRFERSDDEDDAHAYSHLQLTKRIDDVSVATSFQDWIPDSYPAFPLRCDSPIQLFVCMVVSVHGYSANNKREYSRLTIEEAMTQGQAALRARNLLEEMKKMLESY